MAQQGAAVECGKGGEADLQWMMKVDGEEEDRHGCHRQSQGPLLLSAASHEETDEHFQSEDGRNRQ